MKYLLIASLFILLTGCCTTQVVKKEEVKDTKITDTKVEDTKKIEPIQLGTSATLSDCKISIEKTFLWINKMPMIGPKKEFTPLRLTTTIKFDNTNGKDLKLDREIFMKSNGNKFAVELTTDWNGELKAGKVLEVEFKGNNIDSRKTSKEATIIFNFINQDKNSATLKSDSTRINIAY